MKTQVAFRAVGGEAGETITLVRSDPPKLPFGKPVQATIPFDDWGLSVPAAAGRVVEQILECWGSDEKSADGTALIVQEGAGVRLHPAFVSSLSDTDAQALGLPATSKLSLNLKSHGLLHTPDFRIETAWTRLGGVRVAAQRTGARLSSNGQDWRIPEPLFSTLQAVAQVNEAETDAARQEAFAALRVTIGDELQDRIDADGYIEQLRISYASGFSLALKQSAAGFDFDPVLFSRERVTEAQEGAVLDDSPDSLLPPVQAEQFAARFRGGNGQRRSYLLEDGTVVYLDPELFQALKIVRRVQSGSDEDRRAFVRNPQRAIAQARREEGHDPALIPNLFIETQQFSERVSGIDVWRKPVLPWIKPVPNSWLPERFGLQVGEGEHKQVLDLAPYQVLPAKEAAELAIVDGRETFDINGIQVPAMSQTVEALSSLIAVSDAVGERGNGSGETPPPKIRELFFLQVRDNLEDVAYAPLGEDMSDLPASAVEFPDTVLTKPKPHQVDGFKWLASCWQRHMAGALLGDDMGLGKTFQALAFLAWLRAQDSHLRPILIVAPTGLLANWKREIEQHLKPYVLGEIVEAHGKGLARMRSATGRDIELGDSLLDIEGLAQAGLVLTTFETMRDYHLSFARQPFSVIIYDEAQKLKNSDSQMTRSAKTLNARFQLAMTGTPVENRLQDIWSIYDVVHPGLLGSSKAFETAYPSGDRERVGALRNHLVEPQGNRPPLLMRRMKDDCLPGLPEKRVNYRPVIMPPRQAAAYRTILQRAVAIKETGERGAMLEILQRLRGVSLHPVDPSQAANEPTYFEDSARLSELFKLLEEIAAKQEKVLIFCESLAMQQLLAPEIRRRYKLDHAVPRINGEMAGASRQDFVNEFQTRGPGFDAMILSPKAGGVGITLTAANHVVHLSRWWNPAVEDQATDRAYRIGQTRDVTVHILQAVHPDAVIGPTSFDLKLNELIERKRKLSRELLLPGEEDGDAAELLNAVLGTGSASEAVADDQPEVSTQPPKQAAAVPESPAIRSERKEARPSWPTRVAYKPNVARDHAIFTRPIAGEHVASLLIRDPYACANKSSRAYVTDFLKIVAGAAQRIDLVQVECYDADSVAGPYRGESNAQQRQDLETLWRRGFPNGPRLRIVQRSKRTGPDFHDRVIQAKTGSGRAFVWDLGRGIDGVMDRSKECTVNLSEAL